MTDLPEGVILTIFAIMPAYINDKTVCRGKNGFHQKGDDERSDCRRIVGSSGVCAQYIMEQSQMSSQFLTMTRLIFAGFILLTLSFVHGDKVFSIIKNHKDAISLLIFSVVGALTVQLTFLLTIEKSNAATATVLQFLSPTIIVAWFSLVRKSRLVFWYLPRF